MNCVPDGRYEALAVGPLAAGKLTNPDIALFYATPGAMIYFINGRRIEERDVGVGQLAGRQRPHRHAS